MAKRHGIGERTIYAWRERFGGFEANDVRVKPHSSPGSLTPNEFPAKLEEKAAASSKATDRDAIEGGWPYVWLDATYLKARRDHHIVSVAVIVAVAVNTDGRREGLGMTVGHTEFWVEFLHRLARRGLRGVKLVISEAQEGLKATIAMILEATRPGRACPGSPPSRVKPRPPSPA